MKRIDMEGQIFGRLRLISYAGRSRWFCRCECGVERSIHRSALVRAGRVTRSCGCLRQEWLKSDAPKSWMRTISGKEKEQNPTWVGDEVSYIGLHARLRRYRGPASEHACTSCGRPASQWAWNHECPGPLKYDSRGQVYCTHDEEYLPFCVSCHMAYDRQAA